MSKSWRGAARPSLAASATNFPVEFIATIRSSWQNSMSSNNHFSLPSLFLSFTSTACCLQRTATASVYDSRRFVSAASLGPFVVGDVLHARRRNVDVGISKCKMELFLSGSYVRIPFSLFYILNMIVSRCGFAVSLSYGNASPIRIFYRLLFKFR